MPKGTGRQSKPGHRKLRTALLEDNKLAAMMRTSPYEDVMHRGYEIEKENHPRLQELGRQTDADNAMREKIARLQQRLNDEVKRQRAEPSNSVSISPLTNPRRSRIYLKRGKV
jgi:uncharacterized protein YllA (UPF0747 family)